MFVNLIVRLFSLYLQVAFKSELIAGWCAYYNLGERLQSADDECRLVFPDREVHRVGVVGGKPTLIARVLHIRYSLATYHYHTFGL